MRRILSIALAFILLTSNLGFALATHLCGGEAVASKVVLGQETLGCGMESMEAEHTVLPVDGTHFSKTPCCANDLQLFSAEDDFKPANAESVFQGTLLALFIITVLVMSVVFKRDTSPFTYYPPPIIDQDKSVLYQVFRI